MRECRSYSEVFKKRAVEKSYLSTSKNINHLSREIGIPESTLRDWRKKYSIGNKMNETKNHKIGLRQLFFDFRIIIS